MKLSKGPRVLWGTADCVSGLALILFALGILWESGKWPMGTLQAPGPAFMPVTLAVLLGSAGVLIFLSAADSPRLRSLPWGDARHAAPILAICAFVPLSLERLGYRVTTTLLLFFLLGVVERQKWIVVLPVALSLSLGSYWLFSWVLRVPLPKSPLGF